jgi:hypothetical protein
MLKKKSSIIALATLLIVAGSLYVIDYEYGSPANAELVSQLSTGEYVVTYTAGDAQQDSYGWYLPSAFGYKIYFAADNGMSGITFGTSSDTYLYKATNGGHIRWNNLETPRDGAGSLNANGFKTLRKISATWNEVYTGGTIVGVVLNAYGGDFAGGQITTNGGTITDTDVGCTNTYFNHAWNGGSNGGAPIEITSLTITYTCG